MAFVPFWGILLLIRTIFVSPFMVEGTSMLPTLQSGEIFLLDRFSYRLEYPQRDDIVVFYLKDQPDYFYVKRVIGMPGDQIHLKRDGVYLFDTGKNSEVKLSEPYVFPEKYLPERFLSSTNELGERFTVPDGQYFVLGDNRQHSKDSRFFSPPFIPREQIVGRFAAPLTLPFISSPNQTMQASSLSDLNFEKLSQQAAQQPNQKTDVAIELGEGKLAQFKAEIASTPDERAYGLMNRKSLPEDQGMLFLFEGPEELSFWMKNTLIPLDMIFIDADGKIVNIQRMALPCQFEPCELYKSEQPAQYVLEINGGLSDKLGIRAGMRVEISEK